MSKLTLTGLVLPLFLLFASPQASAPKAFGGTKNVIQSQGQSGTLQKMIVQNGSVTMDLDLNRLNGIGAPHCKQPSDCNSLSRPIPSSPFWFLTIFCAARTMAQWRWSRKTLPRLSLGR